MQKSQSSEISQLYALGKISRGETPAGCVQLLPPLLILYTKWKNGRSINNANVRERWLQHCTAVWSTGNRVKCC